MPHCFHLLLACALLAAAPEARAADGPVPWDVDALFNPPAYTWAPDFDEPGVRALFFESVPWQGKSTRVFAWYGVPDTAPGEPVPAMVLVHGGGGTAFAEWVRLWVSRGYAAIAMDTCGSVPRREGEAWVRHDAAGPPGWGGFADAAAAPEDQWPYHAVASVVLAHSLLRSFPEVDAERTGITGISWGGYLTCITAGIDPRFRLAVPVYGCGFLGKNSAWLDQFARMGPELAARWLGLWDPSVYLSRAAIPMLWVTGTNDFAYPMDSLQMSYRLPTGPRALCIRIEMPHGHGGPGENPAEIAAFAGHILLDGPPLPRLADQRLQDGWLSAALEAPAPIHTAQLVYTRERGTWQDRKWQAVDAIIDWDAGRVRAAVPGDATVVYLAVEDVNGLYVSSEHIELPLAQP